MYSHYCRWAARCVLGGYSESKTLDRYQLKKMKHDPYWKYTTAEVEDTYYIGLTGRFRAFYKVAWQHEHKYLVWLPVMRYDKAAIPAYMHAIHALQIPTWLCIQHWINVLGRQIAVIGHACFVCHFNLGF